MKTYTQYPGANLFTNLEELISKSLEEVQAIQEEINLTEQLNLTAIRENKAEVEKMVLASVEHFASMGIDVHKYKTKGWSKVKNGYAAWFNTNVVKFLTTRHVESYPRLPFAKSKGTVHGIEISNSGTMTDLVHLYKQVKKQYNEVISEGEKFTNAVKYAGKHNITIPDNVKPDETWHYVNQVAQEIFEKNELKIGDEIEIKVCDECSSYTIGESRCECGNSRISIEIDGDFEYGFYFYETLC